MSRAKQSVVSFLTEGQDQAGQGAVRHGSLLPERPLPGLPARQGLTGLLRDVLPEGEQGLQPGGHLR